MKRLRDRGVNCSAGITPRFAISSRKLPLRSWPNFSATATESPNATLNSQSNHGLDTSPSHLWSRERPSKAFLRML